jgi:hypothetical protein
VRLDVAGAGWEYEAKITLRATRTS